MARSEEALKRRAEKRQRTVEEQREVDLENLKRQKKATVEDPQQPQPKNDNNNNNNNGFTTNTTNTSSVSGDDDIRMKEAGAWKCRQCGNDNFASRRWCNSKTCNEPRPEHIVAPPYRPPHRSRETTTRGGSGFHGHGHPLDEPGVWTCNSCGNKNFASREKCYNRSCAKPRPADANTQQNNNNNEKHNNIIKKQSQSRHDEATSKKLIWSNQADKETMSKNQILRKLYLETKGEGMEAEDIERAKILIARDERKRQKKKQKAEPPNDEAAVVVTEEEEAREGTTKSGSSNGNGGGSSVEKSKRDKNKTLRKLYEETGGKGMKLDQIERAKQLIERDERKRQQKKKKKQQQHEASQ